MKLNSFDELYQYYIDESSITKASVKEGKMHKMLGLSPAESIPEKYKSGETLGKALLAKTSEADASKMLNYSVNISKNSNPIFKSALDYVEKQKQEEK